MNAKVRRNPEHTLRDAIDGLELADEYCRRTGTRCAANVRLWPDEVEMILAILKRERDSR